MRYLIKCILLTACLIAVGPAHALVEQIIQGKVVGIVDGDTIDVLQSKSVFRVRLLDIDAPESGQPFGKAAKKALSALVFGKEVVCRWREKDRNGRYLAAVTCEGKDVCLSMIELGFAWHYKKANNQQYQQAMLKARARRIGLWQDNSPIDPYYWRKLNKNQRDLNR